MPESEFDIMMGHEVFSIQFPSSEAATKVVSLHQKRGSSASVVLSPYQHFLSFDIFLSFSSKS